jgi:hypothetical protein
MKTGSFTEWRFGLTKVFSVESLMISMYAESYRIGIRYNPIHLCSFKGFNFVMNGIANFFLDECQDDEGNSGN